MKTLRKNIALLLPLALITSAAGCASQQKTTDPESVAETSGISADSTTTASDTSTETATAKADENSSTLSFKSGTYTGSAKGYNDIIELAVTFSDTAITKIEIASERETPHVGTSAYDILFDDIIEANGIGVDTLSGATFTSFAIREAVKDAATQAQVSDLDVFRKNTVDHAAGNAIENTWDVVIVGAGGAGLSAGAQAAQDGNTVLILEKNAEMGGNTLVAGGAFQGTMPYLVWDPADPDAATGEYQGVTYDKIKNDAGRIDTLKTILSWLEDPFDGTLDDSHPFVAGDISLNAMRGVHDEYLDTLKTLKAQISEYLAWAQPQLDNGASETDLTLFSTLELHIFQTYYGGLRPSADGSQWIYGNFNLVKQVIENGQDIKPWLADQGAVIDDSRQSTLIGCLWQRENEPINGVVDGTEYVRNWGVYFKAPENTILKADESNTVMTRTTATDLIVDNGRVVGVKAVQYDGTEITAYATKGVILATGGYGANIDMVQSTNIYWDDSFIADNIGTTNRNSLTGDGILLGQSVGAAVEGMGWTQMMPLGWVDNGNLAGGNGEEVIFINASTGKRYVDESAERDVLSKGAFENGMTKELAGKLGLKYVPGIFVEIANTNYIMGGENTEGRIYTWTIDQAAEKLELDKQTLIDTITEYDNYVMGLSDKLDVEKLSLRNTIGDVEKDENGNYLPETYSLDKLLIRFMAPSTHHTMGGLCVDEERHVLDTDGNIIEGLYAAGEVTGGIHAGNRLGGNAITDIVVSGRTAAQTIQKDN